MSRYVDILDVADVLSENINLSYSSFVDILADVPTADVKKVIRAEWIILEAEIGLYGCSRCEHKILRAQCNYCPNCGATMKGETNGE